MKKTIDFKTISKRIRKRRGIALRKEIDQLIEQSKTFESEASEILDAIENNPALSRKEKNKYLAEFDKECTDLFSECMTSVQSLLDRRKERIPAEIKRFKKDK